MYNRDNDRVELHVCFSLERERKRNRWRFYLKTKKDEQAPLIRGTDLRIYFGYYRARVNAGV